jgi:hypothetical protein
VIQFEMGVAPDMIRPRAAETCAWEGSDWVAQDKGKHESAAELLADWRAAERDTVAAGSTAKIAALALQAATAAEEAAEEVEAAANAAAEAVERARGAALKARGAAIQAAEAANLALATAEGDKVRANHQLEEAEQAEEAAADRFHAAQDKGFSET